MRPLLFVSTYPSESNKRDGYFRRVFSVDQVFIKEFRILLDIRFQKNFRKKIDHIDSNVQVFHLNAVFHYFEIAKLLRNSRLVYIHSVAKVISIIPHLIKMKKVLPFAIDLHGVMVEEQLLAKRPIKAWIYSKIENFCFKNSSLNIYVSEVMQTHFRTKYPNFKGSDVIFATNSNQNLFEKANTEPDFDKSPKQETRVNLESELGINPTDVVLIYSGNCQPWQKIDLMLSSMEKLTASNIKFLILSSQKRKFDKKIKRFTIPSERVRIVSVQPEDLPKYYELAHYGFILRDDILVNRVANPTKLAEYLCFGLIPIVKLVSIGDYNQFNYDYLSYTDLGNSLLPNRSQKNRQVFHAISQLYGSESLLRVIKAIQKR